MPLTNFTCRFSRQSFIKVKSECQWCVTWALGVCGHGCACASLQPAHHARRQGCAGGAQDIL